MTAMRDLYQYYREQPILPTFANLREPADLLRYAELRAAVLRDRAGLPAAMFAGKDVLEFGPDSGENALVFAEWGARLTLVEPNERAHPTIRAYFDRFGLSGSLRDFSSADVLSFQSDRRFDLIVAEGFIYTVKPTAAWLERFRRLLRPNGMFVITYCEQLGGLIEIAFGALQRAYRKATGSDALTAARTLFMAKWDTIPHTRAFESWVMDVIENPFIGATAFLDARTLVDELVANGFDLYASHPHYDDVLGVEWLKRVMGPAERAARARAHIQRSVLSFLAGAKLYIVEPQVAIQVDAIGRRLVADVDALRNSNGDTGVAERASAGFTQLASLAREVELVVDAAADRCAAAELFDSWARAFALVAANDADGLAAHTNGDRAFLTGWGLPVHLAVGRLT